MPNEVGIPSTDTSLYLFLMAADANQKYTLVLMGMRDTAHESSHIHSAGLSYLTRT
jgi:hypothetical protein